MNAKQTIQKIVDIIDYVESNDFSDYDSQDAYYDIRSVIDSYQQLTIEKLKKEVKNLKEVMKK
jgi:hypothetical protein